MKGICFAMMWDDPAIHLQQNDGSLSIKKSDFALKLSAMVEAGDNTGFLANVKRAIDGQQKYVHYAYYFTSSSIILCILHIYHCQSCHTHINTKALHFIISGKVA